MAGTFDFCPGMMVPRTRPPKHGGAQVSMNGWHFAAKPSIPFQKVFVVKLHKLRWHLNADGTFDAATDPQFNARRLEQFYEDNGVWDNFTFPHPHFGDIQCRFLEPVEVPPGEKNSGGLIDEFEIILVEDNPGY